MENKYFGAEVLLTACSNAKKDENILFVTDDTSKEVADILWNRACDYTNKNMIVMGDRTMHGEEPTKIVAAAMSQSDLIFGVTKFSMFHTEARRNAVKNGARFVNMVDYCVDMLSKGGLFVDFVEQSKIVDKVSDSIIGDEMIITTLSGTEIKSKINGRDPLRQYGRSLNKSAGSSPPDIESAIAPLEDSSNGIVYIDGSIPHPLLGLIKNPIKLTIANGKIAEIEGEEEADILRNLLAELKDEKAYYIGEIGIGLNPCAELNGRMLSDEGCMGTVHFGFGSNTTFGGTIESNNHLDMIFKNPTVVVDGKSIMKNGELF